MDDVQISNDLTQFEASEEQVLVKAGSFMSSAIIYAAGVFWLLLATLHATGLAIPYPDNSVEDGEAILYFAHVEIIGAFLIGAACLLASAFWLQCCSSRIVATSNGLEIRSGKRLLWTVSSVDMKKLTVVYCRNFMRCQMVYQERYGDPVVFHRSRMESSECKAIAEQLSTYLGSERVEYREAKLGYSPHKQLLLIAFTLANIGMAIASSDSISAEMFSASTSGFVFLVIGVFAYLHPNHDMGELRTVSGLQYFARWALLASGLAFAAAFG